MTNMANMARPEPSRPRRSWRANVPDQQLSPVVLSVRAAARTGRSRRRRRGRRYRTRDFRALVDLAPDATVVADGDGRIQLVNRQTEVLFGYARHELVGKPVEILIPERLRLIHVQHRARYTAAPGTRPMGADLQLLARRRDGREFPVEVSLGPLNAGGASLVIASIRDITEVQRAQAARRAIEQANQELRRLQALTDTALAHLSLDDMLPALLERVREVMAVDNAAILLLDESCQTLILRVVRGPEEAVDGQVRVPLGQGFAGRIAAARRALIVEDVSTFPVVNLFLREHLRSAMGVPLMCQDRVLGVIHIGTTQPHQFTNADVQLLQRVAERIALAIERSRGYEAEQQARCAAETARQEAEAALARAQESERRFQSLMEADIIGLFVVEDERIVDANDAFLNLVGYTRDDLATGRLRWPDLTPPEYLAVSRRAVQEVLATGACTPFEKEYICKDGSRAPLLLGSVLLDRAPQRFVTFVLDLTERKRLEQEREEARRDAAARASQLDATFDAIADGIIVYDRDGRMLQSNSANRAILGGVAQWPSYFEIPIAERLKRIDLRNELGQPLPPEQWPHLRVLRGEVLAGPTTVEVLARDLDGQVKVLSISGTPLRDEEGTIIGAVCVHRDVTARRQLEREREVARANELAALEVSRQLDQFFSIAAHDIRSPVTAAVGSMQLVQMRFDRLLAVVPATEWERDGPASGLFAAVRNSLEMANQSMERLANLTGRLFDVARARSGMLAVHQQPCDLAGIVRAQVAAQRIAAPSRALILEVPDLPVPVLADADRLGQVLANYLTNAFKYSAEDQPIEVLLAMAEGHAVVAVQDHGPGLPPEEQSQVWEPFHRVPGVEVQNGIQGTSGSLGLGLSICKRIIEAHRGGRVGVESAEGVGSTFWFRLPLTAADPPSSVPAA